MVAHNRQSSELPLAHRPCTVQDLAMAQMVRCVYPAYMTAEPIQPTADPGRSPAAIRDALPGADRPEFARSYAAAIDEARRTWSLQPVETALEQWRRIAVLSRETNHRAALHDGLQLLAGDDVALYPVDTGAIEALRRGELPATWPTT
jgi:hypothetical protein